MFYSEFIKQATDLGGITDLGTPAMDATGAAKAFSLLQTSLLALNTDDRLTFAVDDVSVTLSKPKLVLSPNVDIELAADEQLFHTEYPIEIPPSYIINGISKMRAVPYEDYECHYTSDITAYAFRLFHNKAVLHLRVAGTLKMGLKRPLDIPASITDEVKLTGSALNLLKYKLATELMALYGKEPRPLIDQKLAEYMQRHMKQKTEILPPPVLEPYSGNIRSL
jgi:hypothetical protein